MICFLKKVLFAINELILLWNHTVLVVKISANLIMVCKFCIFGFVLAFEMEGECLHSVPVGCVLKAI
uniref:Uncharacterized protein n=1 Tax=Anguilla anguilla TaxID=7936 RepID=A0A0E9VCX3_ANGAN